MRPASLATTRTARALPAIALLALAGCPFLGGSVFAPGTYSGDVPCTIHVVTASGETGEDNFTQAGTLVIEEDGGITMDGVEVAVGNQVTRSIPNADVSFEITRVSRFGPLLTITYEPRPTLPGISMDGELVETYRWTGNAIDASADADLVLTDVDGSHTFTVDCEGVLTPQ